MVLWEGGVRAEFRWTNGTRCKGRKGVKEKTGYLTGCGGQGRVRAVEMPREGLPPTQAGTSKRRSCFMEKDDNEISFRQAGFEKPFQKGPTFNGRREWMRQLKPRE